MGMPEGNAAVLIGSPCLHYYRPYRSDLKETLVKTRVSNSFEHTSIIVL